MFTMALDFQLVPSKIAQIKSSQVKSHILFLFWCMEIHQSKHKQKRVALNLAEVDCLRKAKFLLFNKSPSCQKNKACSELIIYHSAKRNLIMCVGIIDDKRQTGFERWRLRLPSGRIRGNTFSAKLYLIAFIFTPADFLWKRCVIKLMEIALDFLASFAGKPIYSVYMWVFVVTFQIDFSH